MKIKKGISIFSFAQDLSILECMQLAKKAGFEGIELTVGLGTELEMDTPDAALLQMKEDAKRVGIEISSILSGLYWQFSITSNLPDIRKKAEELIKRQVYIAAKLGVKNILTCAGAVGVDFTPEEVVPDAKQIEYFVGSEIIDYDVCYERALESYKNVAKYGEDMGVNINIENIWNRFLLSPFEMAKFIDEVGSPNVGSYFDVGNCMAFGYPEHWIKILGKRINCVHFKDYRRGVGSLHGFVDLLAGDANWPKVIDAFDQIGYDGWANAEMCPYYKYYSDQIVYNTSASMDRILGRA